MFINLNPYKIFENKQKALSVLRINHIKEDDERYLKIKELLKDNPGYLGRFTEWFFKERIEFDRLEEILKMLGEIKIDKSIDQFKTYEELFDYIQSYETNTKINQVLKALPSRARSLANDELKSLIELNAEYSKELIDFYSKKGGKYNNATDLLNDTKSYLDNLSGGFNLEAKMKLIRPFLEPKSEGKQPLVQIKLASPELLIVQVNGYEASKEIGSMRWCISTSQSMWNSYVNPFTCQYFIYDFTKSVSDNKHMIGATVSPSGKITSAHWADDGSVRDLTYFDNL